MVSFTICAQDAKNASMLVGTRNGRGVGYVLEDQVDSIGRKRITKIYTFIHANQRKWAMYFELMAKWVR